MKIRILHLASFVGNIGDNASHAGFYSLLDNILDESYELEQLEMRKFYMNYSGPDKRAFDSKFVQYVNAFDLLVVGGGGFLDYWVPGSGTGATLDLSEAALNAINVPILITSVGCFPHRPVPEGNRERFMKFLDYLTVRDNVRVALRNDGSIDNIRSEFGPDYAVRFSEVLDSAFFASASVAGFPGVDRRYVAINITVDQIEMLSSMRGQIDKISYHGELRKIVEACITKHGLDVVFVPHVFDDLKAISRLLDELDQFLVRSHVSIAPCVHGEAGGALALAVYAGSTLALGTRFHANVCGIALGVPSIGIAALDRVVHLYRSLGMDEHYVFPDQEFAATVEDRIGMLEKGGALISDGVLKSRMNQTLCFYEDYFDGLGASVVVGDRP